MKLLIADVVETKKRFIRNIKMLCGVNQYRDTGDSRVLQNIIFTLVVRGDEFYRILFLGYTWHTRNHIRLPPIKSDAELADEISGSKHQLEDILSYPVTHFCYPWDEYDERVIAATQEAGFESATTTIRRRARLGVNLMEIPRIPIKRHHWLHVFLMKVASIYGDRR